MTDEEREKEGAEEAIEDLEAPAEKQEDVQGGVQRTLCIPRLTAVVKGPTYEACGGQCVGTIGRA